ncbi:hypothetical protein BHE74_00004469 [Ensete ventricosum]|nr:hypothetical protein BHE74_00004469 [Ensete ventricosum]
MKEILRHAHPRVLATEDGELEAYQGGGATAARIAEAKRRGRLVRSGAKPARCGGVGLFGEGFEPRVGSSSCSLRDGSPHLGTVTSMEPNDGTFVLHSELEKLRTSRSAISTADITSDYTLGVPGEAFSFSHCRNKVTVADASGLTGEISEVEQFIRELVRP